MDPRPVHCYLCFDSTIQRRYLTLMIDSTFPEHIKLAMMGKKNGPSQKDICRHSKEVSVTGLVHTRFLHPLPDPLLLFTQVPTLRARYSGPDHLAVVDSRNPSVALQTCPPIITPTLS